MKAEVVVIFTPLVNISSTEGCERQVSSSDNDSFTFFDKLRLQTRRLDMETMETP